MAYDAQIILAYDPATGKLVCEQPSLNGTRSPVDLDGWTVDDLPPPIADALFAQVIRREAAAKAAAARQTQEETARKKRFFSLSYEARVLGETEAEFKAKAKSNSAKPRLPALTRTEFDAADFLN